jgi:hypothetical protein
MARRKWPWGRIVTGVVAGVILLVAMPLFFTSADIRRRADSAQVAELAHLKADLSKPGVCDAEFCHTFGSAWGLYLQLSTKAPLTSAEESQAVLEGLAGQVTILAPDGAMVHEQSFSSRDFFYRSLHPKQPKTTVMECGFCRGLWSAEGVYKVKFAIDHGSPRMADFPHSLIVRYELDGLEYVMAGMSCLYAIAGCTIAGLLISVIFLVTMAKWGRAAN